MIKKGKRVEILCGKDKGKTGEILELDDQIAGLAGFRPIRVDPLKAMGFKIALFANCVLRAGVKGIQTILSTLQRDGTTASQLKSLITMEERNRLTRLDIIESWEKKYEA